MTKERSLLFKSYTILDEWQFLPQSPSPPEHPEKNHTTLCQISPRLPPELLLPFENTILLSLAGVAQWMECQPAN